MSDPATAAQVPTSFESKKFKLPVEDLPDAVDTEQPFILLSQVSLFRTVLHRYRGKSSKLIDFWKQVANR
jgi:hypothetical protein